MSHREIAYQVLNPSSEKASLVNNIVGNKCENNTSSLIWILLRLGIDRKKKENFFGNKIEADCSTTKTQIENEVFKKKYSD